MSKEREPASGGPEGARRASGGAPEDSGVTGGAAMFHSASSESATNRLSGSTRM